MILGRGTAQTDEAIIAEDQQWIRDASHLHHWNFTKRLREGPGVMCNRIGKPIKEWTDGEILALYQHRTKATWTVYNSFLAFLFFRGYRQATIRLLDALQTDLSRHWKPFLQPYRQKIEQTAKELGYAPGDSSHVLNLLIWLLAVIGVPLDGLTREAFESFRETYQDWYRQQQKQKNVEQAFTTAVEHMQEGPHSWVPNFFVQEDYTLFVEGDVVSWIRLPLGFCRRNPKLHCESDVKCLLCDRFAIGKEDLPRLQQMYERFMKLGLKIKADVVAAQIQRLESPSGNGLSGFIAASAISVAPKRH